MLPSLDPAQLSALFGAAVVQALAAVALFSSLQFGPALKVYFSGSLVEVGAVVGVVVVVEVEVEVEVVVEVVVGSGVGYNGIVGCYYNIDNFVGCYYNIDDDDGDENVGVGVPALLMDEELPEVPQVVQVLPGELRDVGVVAVVVLGLLEVVGLEVVELMLLEELAQAQLELVLVLVELWFASFGGPTWALVAAVVGVVVVHHYLKRYNSVMSLTEHL